MLLAGIDGCAVMAGIREVAGRGTVQELEVYREWAPHVGRFSSVPGALTQTSATTTAKGTAIGAAPVVR
jgi:hypothetical protein